MESESFSVWHPYRVRGARLSATLRPIVPGYFSCVISVDTGTATISAGAGTIRASTLCRARQIALGKLAHLASFVEVDAAQPIPA